MQLALDMELHLANLSHRSYIQKINKSSRTLLSNFNDPLLIALSNRSPLGSDCPICFFCARSNCYNMHWPPKEGINVVDRLRLVLDIPSACMITFNGPLQLTRRIAATLATTKSTYAEKALPVFQSYANQLGLFCY